MKIVNRELVLCAGTINYLYAKSLQSEMPREVQRRVAIEPYYCSISSPANLINEAARRQRAAKRDRNPYDKVWIFFDCPPILNANQLGLKERQKIELAYSLTCLEHWFILHFEEFSGTFRCQQEATQHLKKLWPAYRRGQVDAYLDLRERLPEAIAHAELANESLNSSAALSKKNPYFTVQNLIHYFETIKRAS